MRDQQSRGVPLPVSEDHRSEGHRRADARRPAEQAGPRRFAEVALTHERTRCPPTSGTTRRWEVSR